MVKEVILTDRSAKEAAQLPEESVQLIVAEKWITVYWEWSGSPKQ
jgi:hypothetical protein